MHNHIALLCSQLHLTPPIIHERIALLRSLTTASHSSDRARLHCTPPIAHTPIIRNRTSLLRSCTTAFHSHHAQLCSCLGLLDSTGAEH
eukprot:975394-Rhodomonas_salina.1